MFDPLELLERLAVIRPRPRINVILCQGVLAPRAGWRRQIVQASAANESGVVSRMDVGRTHAADSEAGGSRHLAWPDPPSRSWASLMRRVFGYVVLSCPRCGHTMRLIALIEQADVIRRILRHLGLPTEVPEPAPARAPPQVYGPEDRGDGVVGGFDAAAVPTFEPAIDDWC